MMAFVFTAVAVVAGLGFLVGLVWLGFRKMDM
jgi:hypothetical protein